VKMQKSPSGFQTKATEYIAVCQIFGSCA